MGYRRAAARDRQTLRERAALIRFAVYCFNWDSNWSAVGDREQLTCHERDLQYIERWCSSEACGQAVGPSDWLWE